MKYCFKCRTEWKGIGKPGRRDTCVKCGADLHACLNCSFYDPVKPRPNSAIQDHRPLPGVLGGITGAYILTSIDGNAIKPFVSGYLLLMGVVILAKALSRNHVHREVKSHLISLGLSGGFFDAVGGGGWGPIVTTTLVARGNMPRYAIGSVNFSEFFVTFAQSVTFLLTLGMLSTWKIIIGLLAGGVLAAPLAAVATRKLPHRLLMGMVGVLIIALSVRTLVLALR